MTLHPKNTLISSILGFFFFQKIVSQGLYHLPFLKTFSDFVHFCPKFTIILPFFCRFKIFFWPFLLFSWKIACPYFLEFALTPSVLYVYSKSKKKKKKDPNLRNGVTYRQMDEWKGTHSWIQSILWHLPAEPKVKCCKIFADKIRRNKQVIEVNSNKDILNKIIHKLASDI